MHTYDTEYPTLETKIQKASERKQTEEHFRNTGMWKIYSMNLKKGRKIYSDFFFHTNQLFARNEYLNERQKWEIRIRVVVFFLILPIYSAHLMNRSLSFFSCLCDTINGENHKTITTTDWRYLHAAHICSPFDPSLRFISFRDDENSSNVCLSYLYRK